MALLVTQRNIRLPGASGSVDSAQQAMADGNGGGNGGAAPAAARPGEAAINEAAAAVQRLLAGWVGEQREWCAVACLP